jgi:hypothetical protein
LKAYPRKPLYEELAFIAYHFHWGRAEVLDLPHAERRRWCREISGINEKLDGVAPDPFRGL